jgi:hypothetical protein
MKFRKKPVVIEAFQLTKDFLMETCTDSKGLKMNGDGTISIPTLEGEMLANIGDWIITGVKGERYPCKPDIFEATYERVEEAGVKKGREAR